MVERIWWESSDYRAIGNSSGSENFRAVVERLARRMDYRIGLSHIWVVHKPKKCRVKWRIFERCKTMKNGAQNGAYFEAGWKISLKVQKCHEKCHGKQCPKKLENVRNKSRFRIVDSRMNSKIDPNQSTISNLQSSIPKGWRWVKLGEVWTDRGAISSFLSLWESWGHKKIRAQNDSVDAQKPHEFIWQMLVWVIEAKEEKIFRTVEETLIVVLVMNPCRR